MTWTSLNFDRQEPLRVLCLGAHCDDVEIGCGGTLVRLAESHPDAHFDWVVLSGDEARAMETKEAATRLFPESASVEIHPFGFRDGYMPWQAAEIKQALADFSQRVSPGLIFTHFRDDLHQDHRLVAELTRNLFRDHLILEYEIPKYDGDVGRPNVFVPLEQHHVDTKVSALIDSFKSQSDKHWFNSETFLALLRLRGIEAGRDCQYAEAFHAYKLRLCAS